MLRSPKMHLRLARRLGLGCALAFLAMTSINAQSVLDSISAPADLELSGSISLVMDTARAMIDVRPDERDPPQTKPSITLRHLPATLSGWRIDGETGSLQWPIYVAANEAPSLTRFRLSYRSSAAVLPDTSTLTLAINDVVVGRIGIASPARIAPIDFDIPAGLLRGGFNAVRLSVEQRHGVDCSLGATYELWTDVVPGLSGFLANNDAPPPITLSDLAALRVRSDGAMPIEVMVGRRMKPARVEQVLLAAQAIVLAGRFQMPVVRFVTEATSAEGIRLFVGTSADNASMMPSVTDGNGLTLLPATAGRAPTLIVGGTTEADVAASLAQLLKLATADATGAPAGLRHAADIAGFKVSGGESIRLSDLGLSDTEFSGRMFRRTLTVAMPADVMTADYGKLTIDLAGGYAAGLKPDAQLRVEINGANSASMNLAKSSGDVFRHNEILIPLGQMQPGPNRVDIWAQLATKSDDACDVVATGDHDAKRFLLLANTQMRFPSLARIARAPDLLPFSAGAFPYASSVVPPRLVVPAPDRQSLSAAATIATRMAIAAHAVIPFSFAVTSDHSIAAHTLIVSPAQSLDPKIMDAIGLDPMSVRAAWDNRDAAPDMPASERIVQRVPMSDDIVERWDDMVTQNTVLGSIRATTIAAFRRSTDWAIDLILRPTVTRNAVTSDAALIVAQGFPTNDSENLFTIVTAPSVSALAEGVERLMQPAHWAALRGRLFTMDTDGKRLTSVEATHARYIATQPASLGNARLVAAGWFSLNPMAYVVFVFILAGALAATTMTLVRNVGRRNT